MRSQGPREHRRPVGSVSMQAGEAESSGALVMEARGVSKSYGERKIVDNLSLRVMRGDRLGIVGANGAGKSTLIKLLTGEIAPDSGEIVLGTNLKPVILDQGRAALEPGMTVTDVLTGGRGDSVVVNGRSRHVIGYLKDFLFAPEQARTPVSVLSGGERNRLLIAKALAQPSNLLVLDEPTNDLDLETLDLLQEMLDDYEGTLLLVSHDRDFLDRWWQRPRLGGGGALGRICRRLFGHADPARQGRRGAGRGGQEVRGQGGEGRAARARRPAARQAEARLQGPARAEDPAERIAKLEAAIGQLKTILADAGLYARDPARFEKASTMLAQAEADLAAAEDRWLELEMLREG